jgi:hypothetical protein
MKNSVGILAEVDRARKETIELERGRYGQHLK